MSQDPRLTQPSSSPRPEGPGSGSRFTWRRLTTREWALFAPALVIAVLFYGCQAGGAGDGADAAGAASSAAPTSTSPSPAATPSPVVRIGSAPGEYAEVKAAETAEKVRRYAGWLDSFGSIRLDKGELPTVAADLSRLASRYGGQADNGSVVAMVPDRGATVRAKLSTASKQVDRGRQALKGRQYAMAREAFKQATAALDQVQAPLRRDVRAVEQASGLRLTRRGTVTRAVRSEPATVTGWVDGDTVDTSQGRVRVLGVNTPELKDQCGPAQAAKEAAAQLAPVGQPVWLVDPDSVQGTDRYGRLLRYVDVVPAQAGDERVDVGYSLLRSGLAQARYDSRDGYRWHPREASYRSASTPPPSEAACAPTQQEDAFVPAIALAEQKGEDEYGRRALIGLIPRPHASAAKHLGAYVTTVKRRDDAKAERLAQERRERERREPERRRAAAVRPRPTPPSSSRPPRTSAGNPSSSRNPSSKKSSGSKSSGSKSSGSKSSGSGGGNYSGYTGPRCYAPGGKTWKPC